MKAAKILRKKRKTKIFAVAVGMVLLLIPALAKDKVTTHQVHFDKGTTGSTIKGHVKGMTP